MKEIKLVATDVDRTLLLSNHTLSDVNKAMAHRIVESGRMLALVTGRMFKSVKNVADMLEMDLPIVCFNGGMIRRGLSGEVLYTAAIDKDVATGIITRGMELGLTMHVYIGDEYYAAKRHPDTDYYVYANRVEVNYCADLASVVNLGDVMTILAIGEPELKYQLEREMHEKFGARFNTAEPCREYMDFLAPDVSKGAALEKLCEILGISTEETLGLGDNLNDLTLLETAGTAVAMGNAVQKLKDIADFVTLTNDENGWAHAVAKFVFNEQEKPMKEIKLVATDLDMTLLRSDHTLSPVNKAMAHRVVESGRQLAIVTGRMYKGAVTVAHMLEMDVPIICYNGAMIRRGLSGELLYAAELDKEIAAAVINRGLELGLTVQVYIMDEYYTARPNPHSDYYMHANKVQINYCDDLASVVKDGGVMKVLVIGEPEAKNVLEREMHEKFAGRLTTTQSSVEYLDFLAPGVSKGAALQRLFEMLNVTAEEAMGLGDNLNDLPLLQAVGTGVAMGNAMQPLKDVADFVTLTNDEDGWAHAVAKFVFNE